MSIVEFYLAALGRAFWESVNLGQAIVFIAVAAMGLLGRRFIDPAPVYSRITSARVAFVLLIALVCARLPFAVYGLWDEEHLKRLHTECLLGRARDAQQKRKEFVSQKLQGFYVRAQDLMHKRITPDEFPAWAQEEGRLGKEVAEWIKTNMGEGAAAN